MTSRISSRQPSGSHSRPQRAAGHDTSAGRDGAALAPPAAGIDFVDRGLPASLKAGIGSLSGMDLSDVRVHANSDKPAQLRALAYAQGNDIYLAPGQEKSLPHEAWHVVQQRQGRVQATLRLKGSAINDDAVLEREADTMGARALHATARAAAPVTQGAPAPAAVIQRNVGFEYETNVDTYQAERVPTDAQRRNRFGFPPGAEELDKGDVLVANMSGLHAKADERSGGDGSDLEFETDPFPETAAGRRSLHKALKTLERFCDQIDAKRGASPHLRATHFAAAFGGTAPNALRYLRAQTAVRGGPQATVGVRVDRIADLMEGAAGAPNIGPAALPAPPLGGPPIPAARMDLGGQADIRTVGNAPENVRQGIANYALAHGAVGLPVNFPSAATVGMCALLLSYMVRGTGGVMAYPKQIAPVMARTDFATVFADLPPGEQNYFSANLGAELRTMFAAILAQANVAGGLNGQVFRLNPSTVDAGVDLHQALTRGAWLMGISQGEDRLTAANFPALHADDHISGLGEMGDRQDPVPAGGAGGERPILELRRMQQRVAPHEFTNIAMGIFDYVVALNAAAPGAALPAYRRVDRKRKGPTWRQQFRYWKATL